MTSVNNELETINNSIAENINELSNKLGAIADERSFGGDTTDSTLLLLASMIETIQKLKLKTDLLENEYDLGN
ncbi:hypothetical protein [Vibrio sp. OPT18]|uniref:hypothetical protein n=1 Tax=Vibrio sp. OPT18 TaxID=2778641 RepID=UPI00188305F6|nr:hypothetical protein [Vibrio sp. OPT18]MBE8574264.1 hypothetical protein [Vibrio sp. OPT18]